MDVYGAALKTIELAREKADVWREPPLPEMSLAHLEGMMERWPVHGSETKQCRWLGWMQASVVAMTAPHVTLDDMKRINMENAQDLTAQERLDRQRRLIAEDIFENHHFGEGVEVEAASGWTMVCGRATRDVFFRDPSGGDSIKGRFSVRFRMGDDVISEISAEIPDELTEAMDRDAVPAP